MNASSPFNAPSQSLIPRGSVPSTVSSPGSFLRRMCRAVALLMAAIATHVWIVRAPQPEGPTTGGPIAASVRLADPGRPARIKVQQEILVVPSETAPAKALIQRIRSLRASAETRPAAAPQSALGRLLESTKPDFSGVPVGTAGPVVPEAADALRGPGRVETMELASPIMQSFAGLRPAHSLPQLERESEDDAPAVVATQQLRSEPSRAAAPAAVTAAEPRDALADAKKQEQGVLDVLGRYTRAYERMDVEAAKAVYPSVDDRALQKAFHQLDGQQVRFASCGVSIIGRDANARCRGSATYRTKVGSQVIRYQREWTFNLARDEGGWQIVNAIVQ